MHRLIVKIQPRDVRSFILTDDMMRDLGGVTSGVQSNNSDPFQACLESVCALVLTTTV